MKANVEEGKDTTQEVPCMSLGLGDITAIDQAIQGYLGYVRSAIPSSQTRAASIQTLQNLRLRLGNVQGGQETSIYLPLTVAEIQALKVALEGFARLIRQIVPNSEECDEVLQGFEALCQQLDVMLAPHRISS